MWKNNWREVIWSNLDQEWDLIIVGGGITGAGIFQAAAASWLKTLLVDAHDFSFGTSSRSSKLVHGGFRYLYNRQYQVTFESVRQRERLLKEAPQLVSPLAFTLPNYTAYRFPSWMLRCGLAIYDLMGSKWDHQQLSAQAVNGMFPALKSNGLLKGFATRMPFWMMPAWCCASSKLAWMLVEPLSIMPEPHPCCVIRAVMFAELRCLTPQTAPADPWK